MSHPKWMLVFGGFVATLGMAGMWRYGPGLAETGRVFAWRLGNPALPAVQADLTRLTLCVMIFAIGLLSVQRGLGSLHRSQALSLAGKLLLALTAVGVVGAGKLLFWGLWLLRSSFMVIAESATSPKPDDVELAVRDASPPIALGLGIGAILLAPLVVLALPALWKEIDPARRPASGRMAVLVVTLAAILGSALSLVLACRAGLACVAMLAGAAVPKPSDLADEFMSLLRFGMLGGLGLVVAGAAQILALFTYPRAKPSPPPQ